MKTKLIKILSLCVVFALVVSFAACKDKPQPISEGASSSEPAQKAVGADDKETEKTNNQTQNQSSADNVKPKYADAEIYEKDGVKYAKTEDGTEVEMTGDNLRSMMEDYSKVQGSDSEEEREILDRIQVILDNAERINQ